VADFDPVKAYEDGLEGWKDSPRARALWQESQPNAVYYEPNNAGSSEGQKALLYSYYMRLEPKAFTEVQTEPDCVSHGSRNARDSTRATSILIGREPKSFGGISATEPTYGAREHGGGGMIPAKASMFERDVGYVLRRKVGKYDLSKYDGSIGAAWGRAGGVPAEVKEECQQSKVGIIRQLTTVRDAMDCLANGYAIHSGQYAKWSATPNKQNYHPRLPGGWAHDLATVGYDDTKTFWPFTVFFMANSWGAWNQLPKDWPDDYPRLPAGAIITRAEDWAVCVENGDAWAYGGVEGFPPQRLPDLGAIGLLQK
jgi:hypothetical protein